MAVAAAGPRVMDPARAQRDRRRAVRKMRTVLLVVGFGPLLAILFRESMLTITDRLLAGVVWLLCLAPGWKYLATPPERRSPIPFFPFVCFEFGLYFALQAVIGSVNVYGRFDQMRVAPVLAPELYTEAIGLVGAGIALMMLGYYGLGIMRPRRRAAPTPEWAIPILVRWSIRVLAFGLFVDVLQRLLGNPIVLRGLLYFGSTLSLLAIAMLTIFHVRNELTRRQSTVLWIGVALLVFLRIGTSATAQLVIIALTILFAVWIGGGRLSMRWVWAGVFALVLTVSVRGVVNEHRKVTQSTTDLPLLTQSTLVFDLLVDRVQREGLAATVVGGWETTSSRSALLDLFADVIRQTPSVVPYWNGYTYNSLIGAVVPRFLWPNKPGKILGYLFGHRYGYTSRTDWQTTINLPFLIEFYVNFGPIGVYLGMLLVGMIYRTVDQLVNVPGQSTLNTVVGIGLLLPLLSVESDFSLVFGGLFLTGGALYVVYRFAQIVVVGRRRRARRQLSADDPGAGRASPEHRLRA